MPQREQRHNDRARGEQEHPDAPLEQPVRPGGCPQTEVGESPPGADHRRAVAPQAGADARFPPRGQSDAGHDREQRAHHWSDPTAIESVLQEETRRREQREHADEQQGALAEPLLEVGGRSGWRRVAGSFRGSGEGPGR